ncbi:glycosyltransferase family 4 protein [Hymenobacter canadensis]|uniref:Glycosyltransferase family 4 protein n=1 Tax=Hymenobacter canadensis TaxID=2999067 RepID=A0ABY7LNG6_9BACT|nr:glycosyltransferase family 4 protein [Hymenobacter canadensis]WBA41976.1 glycosyltransferase family 4 protein [Hymenobacter canadensis]
MNILVAVEELRIGGAQTFALRLAQALHEAGHRVYLYAMYWQYTEHDLVQRLAPNVELLEYRPASAGLDTLLLRTDDWLQRHGRALSLRRPVLLRHLRQVVAEKQIDVVSSNTFKCDALLAEALQHFPRVPLVVTMHGDYEQFLAFYQQRQQYVIPNYRSKLTSTIARINGVAYLSEQNLEAVRLNQGVAGNIRLRQIYNGLDGRISAEAGKYTRPQLGIAPGALVFGMVARGVPEKGWEPVIRAYQRLRAEMSRPTNLLLVGASPFLTQLSEKYQDDDSLRFLGFVNNPIDCVRSFDVGILASSLKESLPNSIAEYLFCGKAVISTDVGEIRQMIRTDAGQEAGVLIEFPLQGLADEALLYQAMRRYATDAPLLAQHQQWAQRAFGKFDMKQCIAAYTQLYQDSINIVAS